MTFLTKIPENRLFRSTSTSTTIYCKFEIFHKLENNTIRMNLSSTSSALFSKDVKSLEVLNLNEFQSKNDESLNFILGSEQYAVSKKLLRGTNSSYFKNICQTHKSEIDMTNELMSELENFKILLLIINNSKSVSDYYKTNGYNNYLLKQILITADKYDVLTVKLTCEHYLVRGITIENVMELIQLVFSLNAKFLETHLATFVKFYMKEIMNTTGFQILPQKDFTKFMELIEKNETLIETSTSLL
ncbi:hypothetical protein ALC57_11735 [Trachymyrmex cornetzi]|uniref:BTB domain-containing protein n=1 Tax=Trachymyrmex cornetzi TaxID=471704 RepID=A0A151J234_9HYME|nr:hypothetical protein ALC57_11735 [Trachymyrmex cornetzi]